MNARREQWIEESERCQANAKSVHHDGADKVLPNGGARPASERNGIGEALEIIAE
jgi:hypothetical protein